MWAKVISIVIILCYIEFSESVLTGYESTDLTENVNFGCRWFGGENPRVECKCISPNEEFRIKEKSIPAYDVYSILIANCGKIRIESNAIANMRNLRNVEFKNISMLYLYEDSLFWRGYTRNNEVIIDYDANIPSVKLLIENSTIKHIAGNAIKGRINRIAFSDVIIEHIASFGFSSLEQNTAIIFDSVVFQKLLQQSFKKFATDRLIIKNSVFGTIPSRAFYDISVKHEFSLRNVTVDVLRPAGFIINNPYVFEISNSFFNDLDGEGFKVMTRGGVLIKNNVFNNTGVAAFRAISFDKEDEVSVQTMLFENNVFHKLNKDSLEVNQTSFVSKFTNLQLSEFCDCNNLEEYFQNRKDSYELKCLVDDDVWITVNDFEAHNCSIFSPQKGGMMYIIIGVCIIVLIFIIAGLVYYFKKVHNCDSYGGKNDNKHGKLNMIVPDGRTYRETELHVIVERADLLTTDL